LEDLIPGSGQGSWAPLWVYAVVVGLTGLASGIFSYFYFLLLNFSKVKIINLAIERGNKLTFETCIENLPRILNAVVLIEIIFKITFIISSYLFVVLVFEIDPITGFLPTIAISSVWFIMFCRILPAEIGSRREEQVLLVVFPFLNGITAILLPILYPLNLFMRLVQRKVGPSSAAEEAEHYTEEIMDAVEEGEREGAIREDEADMIEGIVRLHASEVSEVMTPRMDMVCVEVNTPLDEVIKTAIDIGHSRIPVYEDNRDRIMGVLYVKDLLKHWPDNNRKVPPLSRLIRKPFFIPETKMISQLLKEFRENKVHIAIVLDEYGGTAGLVTNEDILEEIVGEIVDEYDKEEERELEILGEGHAVASAKVHIDELNEELEINLPESEDFDTLGGFIFTRLGKVPAKGDVVQCDNVTLTVMEADDRRIDRVSIVITEKPESENGE
jgi:CBS domain containing-hemolysin-like protein